MRIGIDAKRFFRGPISTRIILQNLLPKLFELYPDHEWVIFLDKKDLTRKFPFEQKNISAVYVWGNNTMLSNLFVLPRYIHKLKVDVTVFQTFSPPAKDIKSIAFIHDVLFRAYPQFFTWKERFYFWPISRLAPKASRLMATTDFVAIDLVKYGYARTRSHIDIIPLGVSPEFKPLEKHDSNFLKEVKAKFRLPDKYLLFVGRLNVRKNIENLLRTLPLLNDQDIKLVIIGEEDWKAPALKEIVNNLQLNNRVIMTASMSTEEIYAAYAMSKIFCFPSFAEGFGLPPLEAMASGIPVVVSATTSLPEVCGNAALYVEPDKPEDIARAIDKLLEDPELYQQKKIEGLQRASKYTWEITAHEFVESLKKTVSITYNR